MAAVLQLLIAFRIDRCLALLIRATPTLWIEAAAEGLGEYICCTGELFESESGGMMHAEKLHQPYR